MTTATPPPHPARRISERNDMPSIGILSVHPAPYRDPTHVGLFEQEADVRVLHFNSMDKGHAEWALRRDPRDRSEFLDVRSGSRLAPSLGVLRWLRAASFDLVVIPGYATGPALSAILYCIATRTPFVLALDTVDAGIRTGFVGAFKRAVVSKASGLWVPGKSSRRFFETTGWPAAAIAEGAYCLDVDGIARMVATQRGRRTELRRSLGISDSACVFLSIGKLISTRRMDLLASTICALSVPEDIHLVVIGDGAQEPRLRELATASPGRLTHIPRLPFDALPDMYALADVYVHAGSEPYSTACEYAAAAGLAMIMSPRVGYHADLVALTDGSGVSTFDSDDDLAAALVDQARRLGSGRRTVDTTAVLQRSPAWAGRQLMQLVRRVIRNPVRGGRTPARTVS